MPDTHLLRVCAYGCNLQVEAPSRDVLEVLERHLLPGLPRVGAFEGEPDGVARLRAVDGGLELVTAEGGRVFAPSAMQMLQFLIRALDDTVIRCLRGWFAVHAGTVAWRGRALLIPGMSHAGKSSLVAALLRRGATYYSDEYAMIDAEGMVHPYPRPVLLRNGGPFQEPMLPTALNAEAGRGPAPVGWIFQVHYAAGGAWSVEPMEQSRAVFALLKNTPHVLADAPEMMRCFERAVQSAQGFHGERGEAEDAAERILQIASA
ncbi:MAG: hypothetical protein KGL64_03380 [Acidobacteriota bacterium]|nr:hypothetical protein [Acidobacteriota bacterium]